MLTFMLVFVLMLFFQSSFSSQLVTGLVWYSLTKVATSMHHLLIQFQIERLGPPCFKECFIPATVEEDIYLLIQMLDNWFNDQGRCCSGPDGLVPELANQVNYPDPSTSSVDSSPTTIIFKNIENESRIVAFPTSIPKFNSIRFQTC